MNSSTDYDTAEEVDGEEEMHAMIAKIINREYPEILTGAHFWGEVATRACESQRAQEDGGFLEDYECRFLKMCGF